VRQRHPNQIISGQVAVRLGATGAMILGTLLDEMERRDLREKLSGRRKTGCQKWH
jgi:acetyl-CoA acetyltransferase